jgi:16S rRNA C1402 N4-methylase RsmH
MEFFMIWVLAQLILMMHLGGLVLDIDGPLDMRFDTKKETSLSDWVNNALENDIKEVLYKYGDEKHAKVD